jgi:DNA primase
VDLRALDAGGIKARLPIVYVLDRYRIPVEDGGDGRWAAVCPFHPDREPSLDVYGERLERWGCFPCGARGDVFDLIGRLAWPEASPSFSDVRRYALVLLDELEASDWTGPTEGVARTFDSTAARALVAQSSLNDRKAIDRFLAHKHAEGALRELTAGDLVGRWSVGSRLDEIIIPYFNRDGDLVSYKHRTALTKALSPPGKGQFSGVLYGEWWDCHTDRTVVLCEGETDTWAANQALLWSDYTPLGVPTGVGSHPLQAVTLAGRDVRIAFDGDEAGRAGALRWAEALASYGASVRILDVPEKTDLAMLPLAELSYLLTR